MFNLSISVIVGEDLEKYLHIHQWKWWTQFCNICSKWYKIVCSSFFHLLFGYPTANFETLSRGNLTNQMLITAFTNFDLRVTRSITTRLVSKAQLRPWGWVDRPETFLFWMQRLNPLRHSPQFETVEYFEINSFMK